MPVIELVVTVCLMSTPDRCGNEHFPVYQDISLSSCVMQAMPTVAQWAGEHQEYLVKSWHCRYYADRERDA